MRINQNASCKIYSRKRLNFINFKGKKRNEYYSVKRKKISIIIFIMILICIACYITWNSIDPIFEALCMDKAKEIATKVTNEESTKVMEKYQYDDLFTVEKDSEENIQLISANILKINEITSDIAVDIQEALKNNENNDLKIASGSITGFKLLSGAGPKINLKISSAGNVKTDLKSEFTEQSINHTLHRVYLDIECEVNILTPFKTIKEKINNQLLLVENVIIGKIPEAYYELNGIENTSEMLQLVK